MDFFPDVKNATQQTNCANIPDSTPKISMAKILLEMGVLVAPANTATNPIPAKNAVGNGINMESALPNMAPMKNKGVTSPPLNPDEMLKTVSPSLRRNEKEFEGDSNDPRICSIPSPI